MRIYLDVSCLGRRFDDPSQMRIRLEAEAIAFILEKVDREQWEHAASAMVGLFHLS